MFCRGPLQCEAGLCLHVHQRAFRARAASLFLVLLRKLPAAGWGAVAIGRADVNGFEYLKLQSIRNNCR